MQKSLTVALANASTSSCTIGITKPESAGGSTAVAFFGFAPLVLLFFLATSSSTTHISDHGFHLHASVHLSLAFAEQLCLALPPIAWHAEDTFVEPESDSDGLSAEVGGPLATSYCGFSAQLSFAFSVSHAFPIPQIFAQTAFCSSCSFTSSQSSPERNLHFGSSAGTKGKKRHPDPDDPAGGDFEPQASSSSLFSQSFFAILFFRWHCAVSTSTSQRTSFVHATLASGLHGFDTEPCEQYFLQTRSMATGSCSIPSTPGMVDSALQGSTNDVLCSFTGLVTHIDVFASPSPFPTRHTHPCTPSFSQTPRDTSLCFAHAFRAFSNTS